MVDINGTLIAQVLNFLFLVFILAKFAYKPLVGVMEDRKNKIASDLETAEKSKQDAEAIKAEYAAKLSEARQEAQTILDTARKTAQAEHDRIMAETRVEQEQFVASSRESIILEKKKAMNEIRGQVVALSMIAAGKIVEQKLGSEEDKQLAGSIVDGILNK